MDYLKINFEALRNGEMKNTFDALERAFKKFNIDYYLIGAYARDMWLNHLDYLPERRTTVDIDFSIYINYHEQFEELKAYLVSIEGFTRDEEPYRLYSSQNHIVDLIPFGGIEKNNIVYLNGNPPTELSVFGNTEVLNHASVIKQIGQDFKVCNLPGLCVLKLLSGNDKPERFPKDMGDFYYIIENYFEIAGDEFFNGNYDDLIEEEFIPVLSAAKMLGRQMRPIISESKQLTDRIQTILEKLKDGFTDLEIDEMYTHNKKDKKILRYKLLSILNLELLT